MAEERCLCKKMVFSFAIRSLFRTFETRLEGTFVRETKKNEIFLGFLLTYSYLCKTKRIVANLLTVMKRFLVLLMTAVSALGVAGQTITNASFEDGTNGWTVSKMQLQTNDGM